MLRRAWKNYEIEYIKNNYLYKSDPDIADHLKRKREVVLKKRNELGLKRNDRIISKLLSKKLKGKKKKKGPKSSNWKGGRLKIGQYYFIYQPNHPHKRYGVYIQEHRYVMEQHIGRYLKPYPIELVHHINGNKLDNRITNLKVMSKSEHQKHHVKGKNNPMYDTRRFGENNPNYKHGKYCI